MNLPIITVIVVLSLTVGVVLYLKLSGMHRFSRLGILSIFTTVVWLLTALFGEFFTKLGINSVCHKYIGCDLGFFGYDAIEHFLSGIAFVFIILWLFRKFPKYSTLVEKYWKNMLTVFAYTATIAILWEIGECLHDFLRASILHEHLLNFRFHVNLLDQPNNIDTMGDIVFNLLGSIISLIVARFVDPDSLKIKRD